MGERELHQSSPRLLRPSAPDSEDETARLLRPAGAAKDNPDELLRPVGNTED